jgi:RNA polymerase sigma factor (sigma-70 family)
MSNPSLCFNSDDTLIGGAPDRFPVTQWSAIVALRSEKPSERTRAFDAIVATYWKPVYKHIRLKWGKSNEDAKDLTQGFFTKALEKEFFQGSDPAKARFRTFLRTCLDGFVANENNAAQRLKRGGQAVITSLDFESAEGELKQLEIPSPENIEQYFEQEWIRSLFSVAIDGLRSECALKGKDVHFQIFQRYDLDEAAGEKLSYDQLATEFKTSASNVTNYLAYARREFRRIVLEKLREMTATDEEFQSEARAVLGVDLR